MNSDAEGRCPADTTDIPVRVSAPHSAFAVPDSKGFTLIEVLLSLAILAAVVGAVYAAFATGARSVAQAEAVGDDANIARTLLARLCDDITNASLRTSGRPIFFGQRVEREVDGVARRLDSLSLTTLTNWRRPGTKEQELWELGYFFRERPGGRGTVLVRREKRDVSPDAPPPLEGGEEIELTDRVREFRLRYHDGLRPEWRDEWDTRRTPSLPKRVEISLVLDSGRVYATQADVRGQ